MVRTTKIGSRPATAVEIVHDDDQCFGFIRRSGETFRAWRSDDGRRDYFVGEFPTKSAAVDAVVAAALRAQPMFAPQKPAAE
jgi:hypothetical protein